MGEIVRRSIPKPFEIISSLWPFNHPELGLDTKEKHDAYNRKHRDAQVYLYAPAWENENYLGKLRGVYNKYINRYVTPMACGGKMHKYDGESEDTGQIQRIPLWQRMLQIGTMAEAPAVMTAAGMEVNPDLTVTYGNDNEGVRQLRDNLRDIGIMGATSLFGSVPGIGKSIATGIDLMGRAAMPSTFLKGVASYVPKAANAINVASPYLDAGAMSLWTSQAGQAAADAGKRGDYGQASALGAVAALPVVSTATPFIREAYSGLKNLGRYRTLLKDPSNYRAGFDYARDKYMSRADLLDRNMRLAAGQTPLQASDPHQPRLVNDSSVFQETPDIDLSKWGRLGYFKKYLGRTDSFTGDITLNPYQKQLTKIAWRDPQRAIRMLDETAAHEGTHWALKKLGGMPLVTPTDVYYEANPHHPLFHDVTWQFADKTRDLSRFGKHEAWMRSPEEFVAEMTDAEYTRRIPIGRQYPQWDMDEMNRINNFLGNRFGFSAEDAGEIARRFSLFGYDDGGELEKYSN